MKQKRYGLGWVPFAALTMAAWIGVPRPLFANASASLSQLNPEKQRSSDANGEQQSPSPRPQRSGSNGSGVNLHPRTPRNGAPAESPEPRPNPTQPQSGGPAVHPGIPDPRPSHPSAQGRPPIRPSPQPPAYHHTPHRRPRPNYRWGNNGWRLHQFFFGDGPRMQPTRRHYFFAGEYFPLLYLPYMQPIPPQILEYLPPVPPGYDIGYYDGYGLVYDPNTLMIISVIDLYRY